jgi:hypothetical protein
MRQLKRPFVSFATGRQKTAGSGSDKSDYGTQSYSSRVLNGEAGKIKAAYSSETMVTSYHITRRHIPEYSNLQLQTVRGNYTYFRTQ